MRNELEEQFLPDSQIENNASVKLWGGTVLSWFTKRKQNHCLLFGGTFSSQEENKASDKRVWFTWRKRSECQEIWRKNPFPIHKEKKKPVLSYEKEQFLLDSQRENKVSVKLWEGTIPSWCTGENRVCAKLCGETVFSWLEKKKNKASDKLGGWKFLSHKEKKKIIHILGGASNCFLNLYLPPSVTEM